MLSQGEWASNHCSKIDMSIAITAIVVVKNEQDMIANCLETLRWCQEVLVIDTGSDDTTVALAERNGARVVAILGQDMASVRSQAVRYCKTEWIFYVDADERVTPQLSQEIAVHIETNSAPALRMKRLNINYGQLMQHGGWETDTVTRVFRKKDLSGWYGPIHESPRFTGEVQDLHSSLIHLTHRSVVAGLHKTIEWTPIEAKLLAHASIPPVTGITIIRKGVMEVVRRLWWRRGYLDGQAGWVEALTQGLNRMLVYMQVWELQQQPPIEKKYLQQEQKIVKQWEKTQ